MQRLSLSSLSGNQKPIKGILKRSKSYTELNSASDQQQRDTTHELSRMQEMEGCQCCLFNQEGMVEEDRQVYPASAGTNGRMRVATPIKSKRVVPMPRKKQEEFFSPPAGQSHDSKPVLRSRAVSLDRSQATPVAQRYYM